MSGNGSQNGRGNIHTFRCGPFIVRFYPLEKLINQHASEKPGRPLHVYPVQYEGTRAVALESQHPQFRVRPALQPQLVKLFDIGFGPRAVIRIVEAVSIGIIGLEQGAEIIAENEAVAG